MKRVNHFQFYQLGSIIHPLTELHDRSINADIWITVIDAQKWLSSLLNDELVPLQTCRSAANKLLTHLKIIAPNVQLEGEAWEEELQKPVMQYWAIRRAATEFENVLAAELETMATYHVSQKGIYSTNDLIQNAEQHFTPEVQAQIPAEAVLDIRQAGKALAFDLDTACGFHTVRATETMIHQYYLAVTGNVPKRKDRNWGAYVRNLNAHLKADPNSKADRKLIALIDQIREHHRNPVIHPEITLTPDEAQSLFSICQGVIITFSGALRKLSPPSVAVVRAVGP